MTNLPVTLPPSGSETVAEKTRELVHEPFGGETLVGVFGAALHADVVALAGADAAEVPPVFEAVTVYE